MPERVDLSGRRFTRLTILGPAPQRRKHGPAYWKCRCDCGTEKEIRGTSMTTGATHSCGCLHAEISSVVAKKYLNRIKTGLSRSPTYQTWNGLRQRCSNPKATHYSEYGGRGITVCARWKKSFENFLADMGIRPPGRTIDRINNDGNYEPGNCRWATPKEQQQNRRISKNLTYCGETRTVADWARKIGRDPSTVHERIAKGWPIEKVLSMKRFGQGGPGRIKNV